jgi:hypothetical protein
MTTPTTRRLLASVALGGLCAAAVLTASPARADADSFLQEINDLGWYHTTGGDRQLLANGYAVCRMLGVGNDGNDVADYIYRNTPDSIGFADAAEFVIVSVENLCPQYDHRGEGNLA